jgi:hypothetical protein
LSVVRTNTDTPYVFTNVIIHIQGELPVVADMESLPAGGDVTVTFTNVRTIDGKRPPWVHDRNSTFVIPISVVRVLEAPVAGSDARTDFEAQEPLPQLASPPPAEVVDEEPDEDLLARIRSV